MNTYMTTNPAQRSIYKAQIVRRSRGFYEIEVFVHTADGWKGCEVRHETNKRDAQKTAKARVNRNIYSQF